MDERFDHPVEAFHQVIDQITTIAECFSNNIELIMDSSCFDPCHF